MASSSSDVDFAIAPPPSKARDSAANDKTSRLTRKRCLYERLESALQPPLESRYPDPMVEADS